MEVPVSYPKAVRTHMSRVFQPKDHLRQCRWAIFGLRALEVNVYEAQNNDKY